jgi:hypothetical protein
MIRLIRTLAAVILGVAVGIPLGAGSATADPLDLECTGTMSVTFTPGLTLTPTEQTVTTNEIYAPCTSASNPAVTSGQSGVTRHIVMGCLDLAQPGSGAETFTWNTGQTSEFNYNRTISRIGGNTVVTLTGAITQGLFAGDAAVSVIVGPTVDTLKCLIPPGITSLFAVITLTITST